jgi:hypothetical protein
MTTTKISLKNYSGTRTVNVLTVCVVVCVGIVSAVGGGGVDAVYGDIVVVG